MPVSFPTLSVGQVVAHPTRAYDPSLRSQKEDGLIISRRKYTGNKQQFEIKYDNITAADKVLLETL